MNSIYRATNLEHLSDPKEFRPRIWARLLQKSISKLIIQTSTHFFTKKSPPDRRCEEGSSNVLNCALIIFLLGLGACSGTFFYTKWKFIFLLLFFVLVHQSIPPTPFTLYNNTKYKLKINNLLIFCCWRMVLCTYILLFNNYPIDEAS